MLCSTFAHAKIKSIDVSKALKKPGVKSILTGNDCEVLFGELIDDMPPIAKEKVRYYGQPVALVVADCEQTAIRAANLIKIEYEPLPVVNSVSDAIKKNAILNHENLTDYKFESKYVYPQKILIFHTL